MTSNSGERQTEPAVDVMMENKIAERAARRSDVDEQRRKSYRSGRRMGGWMG